MPKFPQKSKPTKKAKEAKYAPELSAHRCRNDAQKVDGVQGCSAHQSEPEVQVSFRVLESEKLTLQRAALERKIPLQTLIIEALIDSGLLAPANSGQSPKVRLKRKGHFGDRYQKDPTQSNNGVPENEISLGNAVRVVIQLSVS